MEDKKITVVVLDSGHSGIGAGLRQMMMIESMRHTMNVAFDGEVDKGNIQLGDPSDSQIRSLMALPRESPKRLVSYDISYPLPERNRATRGRNNKSQKTRSNRRKARRQCSRKK